MNKHMTYEENINLQLETFHCNKFYNQLCFVSKLCVSAKNIRYTFNQFFKKLQLAGGELQTWLLLFMNIWEFPREQSSIINECSGCLCPAAWPPAQTTLTEPSARIQPHNQAHH